MQTVKISDKLYWLGKRDGTDFMQINSYLLTSGHNSILIDPCPHTRFNLLRDSVEAIVPIESLDFIVLHHQDPDLISGLIEWEKAGFKGKYVAHWRTAMFLPCLSLKQPVISINEKHKQLITGELKLDFIFTPYLNTPGSMMSYDPDSETLFSGRLFNANGFEKSRLWAEPEDYIKQKTFFQYYMPSSFILHSVIEKLEELQLKLILPQQGYLIKNGIKDLLKNIKTIRCGALLSQTDNKNLLTIYENLQNNLKGILTPEDLRLLENERMKDSLTGFYKENFFLDFIKAFSGSNDSGILLFIKIDEMEEFNERFGTDEGDLAIESFAQALLNFSIEKAVFFRLSGPVCICFIPELNMEKGVTQAEEIRNEFEKSDQFLSELTVSVGIVDLTEINCLNLSPKDFAERCLVTGKKRLSILEKMGPSSICKTSQLPFMKSKKGTVLILNEDRYEAEVLRQLMVNEFFEAFICENGKEALRLIDVYKPDVILSELYLPQLSAFQLRRKMLNSSDIDSIPMVIMSHRKNENSVKRAFKLEIYHYLKKPIFKAELVGVISHIIDERRKSL